MSYIFKRYIMYIYNQAPLYNDSRCHDIMYTIAITERGRVSVIELKNTAHIFKIGEKLVNYYEDGFSIDHVTTALPYASCKLLLKC